MKIDNEKLDALIKGALLHDIGKVCERALGNFDNHAKEGGDFLNEVLKGCSYNEQKKEIITNCVKLHHDDDSIKDDMAKIICNADTYASKIDRRKVAEEVLEKDYKEDYVKNAYRYLRSVFNIFNKREKLLNSKHPLYNLDMRFKFKKVDDEKEIEIAKESYDNIYKSIKNKFIKNNVLKISNNKLLDILEDHLSLIPSDTKKINVCDNSLFSHSKLTAAIVNCMGQYKGCNFKDEESILLIAYKLNNIKEFVFRSFPIGTLNALRGHSCYVSLLMENINDEILTKLNLSRANLLYNTGDEIYILAANNKETVKSLMQIKEEYNKWTRERFGNSLYMTMAYKPKKIYTLFGENHNQRQFLNELYSKLMMDKLNMISEIPGYVNSVRDFNFNDMGEKLSEQDIFFSVTDIYSSNAIEIFSSDKNKKNYLLLMSQQELEKYDMTHLKRIYSQNKVLMHPCESIRLWMPDYSYNAAIDISDTYENGKENVGILKIKVDNLSEAFSKGFTYEDKRYATLGRYAALARNINFFFKIIISKICKGELLQYADETVEQFNLFSEKERKEKKVKIVYSLCGEICLVGDREDLLELAVDIQNNFESFTNNQLTLSAALGVFSKKFSVKKMLELTYELEKLAKNNANDSIAFFIFEKDNTNDNKEVFTPQIYHWKEFVEDVCEIKIPFLRQKIKNDKNFLYELYVFCIKGIYGFKTILRISMEEKQYYSDDKSGGKEFYEKICSWMEDYDNNRSLKAALYLLFYNSNEAEIKRPCN